MVAREVYGQHDPQPDGARQVFTVPIPVDAENLYVSVRIDNTAGSVATTLTTDGFSNALTFTTAPSGVGLVDVSLHGLLTGGAATSTTKGFARRAAAQTVVSAAAVWAPADRTVFVLRFDVAPPAGAIQAWAW